MEVGDHGAPTPPAAELAEEAVRQELDLATILVLHMEAHLVLDLPQTQDPATQIHVLEMEIGDHGAPMAPAAELVEEAHKQELVIVTTPVQPMEAHRVQDLPQTQEPATQIHVQEMEIGGLGAPMAPAAELVVEAHRGDPAIVTTPVQHTEAHLVRDLPQNQDSATHTIVQ